MGGGGQDTGEEAGTSKGPVNDVKSGFPGSAFVWGLNVYGQRCDDDSPGRFSSYYCHMDCSNDGTEGQRQRMGVGLG